MLSQISIDIIRWWTNEKRRRKKSKQKKKKTAAAADEMPGGPLDQCGTNRMHILQNSSFERTESRKFKVWLCNLIKYYKKNSLKWHNSQDKWGWGLDEVGAKLRCTSFSLSYTFGRNICPSVNQKEDFSPPRCSEFEYILQPSIDVRSHSAKYVSVYFKWFVFPRFVLQPICNRMNKVNSIIPTILAKINVGKIWKEKWGQKLFAFLWKKFEVSNFSSLRYSKWNALANTRDKNNSNKYFSS